MIKTARKVNQATTIKYQGISQLTAANSTEFDAFTFPLLSKRWQVVQQRGPLTGIAALDGENIVGLIIAESLPDSAIAEILSFFVVPAYRHQGIGTRLLFTLEKTLRKLKFDRIKLQYQATDIAQVALEPILSRLGWPQPEMDFLLVQSTTERVAQAPWLSKYMLPKCFTVFPWEELSVAERNELQQRQDIPPQFSPFNPDPRFEPLTSLGLKYGDRNLPPHARRVVGWMITHRIDSETIRYTVMYVEPKFQKLARGISLFVEALKRQIQSQIPVGKYAVSNENTAMIRFVQRHVEPYASLSESRQAYKILL